MAGVYAAGAAIPLVALLVWLAAAGQSVGGFVYTLFGFRLQLLHTLAGSDIPLHVRLRKLEEPAWDSGLALALGAALVGLRALRHDRVLVITFSAWLAAATFGVLGGGSYFAHYLIGLVPVTCVAAAVAIAGARLPTRIVVLGAVLVVALPTAREGALYESHHPLRRSEVGVAGIRTRPRPPGRHRLRHVRAAQRRLLRRPATRLPVHVEPDGQSQARRARGAPAAVGLVPGAPPGWCSGRTTTSGSSTPTAAWTA